MIFLGFVLEKKNAHELLYDGRIYWRIDFTFKSCFKSTNYCFSAWCSNSSALILKQK